MLKRILLVISCCTFFGLAPGVQAADDMAAVTAVAEKFRVLLVDPEEAKLNALLFDELSYGHSAGKIDTKKSLVESLMAGTSNFESIDITEQTVSVVKDIGIVRHTLAADVHNKGQEPKKIKLKVVQVWKKVSGKWKLLVRQAITAP